MMGILELLIVLVLFGGVVGGVVLITFLVIRSSGGRSPDPSNQPNLIPCPDCGQLISIRATASMLWFPGLSRMAVVVSSHADPATRAMAATSAAPDRIRR